MPLAGSMLELSKLPPPAAPGYRAPPAFPMPQPPTGMSAFDRADINGDGTLDRAEFANFLRYANGTGQESTGMSTITPGTASASGWRTAMTADGRLYYYHTETGEVSWTNKELGLLSPGGVKVASS